jgi:hypothetical protein
MKVKKKKKNKFLEIRKKDAKLRRCNAHNRGNLPKYSHNITIYNNKNYILLMHNDQRLG